MLLTAPFGGVHGRLADGGWLRGGNGHLGPLGATGDRAGHGGVGCLVLCDLPAGIQLVMQPRFQYSPRVSPRAD